MKFRPCIDIHDGKVKQIVGSSLTDDSAVENFVSKKGGADFATLYKDNNLKGGHIVILNKIGTKEYEESKLQAISALSAYPDGLQIGGGITADNAKEFIDKGASHVIVTSYVFKDGQINFSNLDALKNAVGKEHIVLDLSCKKVENDYFITTDRWQKLTDVKVDSETLTMLSNYCDEYLIHAVDVEGKQNGIEEELVERLSSFSLFPITYAGGVKGFDDIDKLNRIGNGRIDVTIGSALDIFGGPISFEKVVKYMGK